MTAGMCPIGQWSTRDVATEIRVCRYMAGGVRMPTK